MSTEATPKNRPKRTPLAQRNIMTVSSNLLSELKRRGLHPHWVNDQGDRIQAATEAGYQFVDADVKVGDERVAEPGKIGSAVCKSVGGGTKAYLMVTREEYYQEDRQALDRKVDESEAAMRKPRKINAPGADGMKVYGQGLTDE